MTQKEVLEKYPELFGTDLRPQVTCMAFGFEVGKGWFNVIEKHLPQMSAIVKKQNLTDFKVTQVKEKFGGLSFYTNYIIDEIDEIVDEMEEECSKTCEKCGNPGTFRPDGWMRVTCDKCEKLRK